MWVKSGNLTCAFCKLVSDSHGHLFFNCAFTGRIWDHVRKIARLHNLRIRWMDIVDFFSNHIKGKSLDCIIKRLCLTYTVFCIWKERNIRLFQKMESIELNIIKEVEGIIRLKLLRMNFLFSKGNVGICKNWGIKRLKNWPEEDRNTCFDPNGISSNGLV